jgi:hypothetical protein
MNRRIPLLGLLTLVFVVPSLAQGVYKWEDENGQVHYSDVPHEGAEEIELQPVQTFSLPAVTSASDATKDGNADTEDQVAPGYASLAITSPSMEETIWNTGGKVTVNMSLQPSLQMGHSIRLFLDGQMLVDLPTKASSVQLSEVYRGEHKVSAEVQNENGQVLIKADPVTFFYHQSGVNSPGRGPGPF